MQFAYPVEFSSRRRNRVTFPDFPDLSARGAGKAEACARGRTILVAALEECVRERRPIPQPSAALKRPLLEPPTLVAAKLALYGAMREVGLSNVALARELGTVEGTVRRLIDLRHRSHIDQVEAALAVLGKRLLVTVRRA